MMTMNGDDGDLRSLVNHLRFGEQDIFQTNTLASASAPALANIVSVGWKQTSKIASSNFLRCEVISCMHVLALKFHSRTLQS